jgi:hypothetical protein
MKSIALYAVGLCLIGQTFAGIFLASPVCKTVWEEQCWDEPATECKTIQVPVTRTETRRQCSTTIEQICSTVIEKQCTTITEKVCDAFGKCWDEPRQKCWDEPRQVCQGVPREQCWDEPITVTDVESKEECFTTTRKQCKQVDRQVCH